MTVNLYSSHYLVNMSFLNSLSFTPGVEKACSASKEEFFIELHELIVPEPILVEHVRGEQFCSHPSRPIFDAFSRESSFDGSIIPMSLGISLFE